MEQRLAESQRMQAAGDQQLQQLAQQCGQLTAERDQLARQLEESRAAVAEKEARVEELMRQLQEYRSVQLSAARRRQRTPQQTSWSSTCPMMQNGCSIKMLCKKWLDTDSFFFFFLIRLIRGFQ